MPSYDYSFGPKYVRKELARAYKGSNSYGGTEAEIYAYRVLGREQRDELTSADNEKADTILQKAIDRIKRKHPKAVLLVDGSYRNLHRVHVVVRRRGLIVNHTAHRMA